jgi:hypothetical protein
MYSLIWDGLAVSFMREADRHIERFPSGFGHFIFYKYDVCIEPSITKARYYLVLLGFFFFKELTNQISNLHII